MMGEILILAGALAAGFDASVVTIPEQPIAGRPFAIETTGAYDDFCQSLGLPVAYGMQELDGGPAYVIDIETLSCSFPLPFGNVLRSQAYGAFAAASDVPGSFTLVIRTRPMGDDSPFVEFARTTVELSTSSDIAVKPSPGIYWNPESSGSGYSIERQGDSVFIAAFIHSVDGDPVWQTAQGTIIDGILEGEFIETRRLPFSPGQPLELPSIPLPVFGPDGPELDFGSSQPPLPMTLFSLGSAGVLLTLTDMPVPALRLQRFPLALASRVDSIFGSDLVSLEGEWYVADVTNDPQNSPGKVTLVQDTTDGFSSAEFATSDGGLRIACARQFSGDTTCALEIDEVVVAEVPKARVSHDHIDFGAIKAWRLD